MADSKSMASFAGTVKATAPAPAIMSPFFAISLALPMRSCIFSYFFWASVCLPKDSFCLFSSMVVR